MKTTSIILFLFISTFGISQTCDLLVIPSQNSLVATYKSTSPIGAYIGGYYVTTFPQPYIYTTPLRIVNRVGISLGNNKVSIMGGLFSESYVNELNIKPDLWVKINPLRIIFDVENGFDLSLGLNYSNTVNYGVGISLTY